MKRKVLAGAVVAVLSGLLLAGCSTVTPLGPDVARESPRFGQIGPPDAVQILKTKMHVSGEIADYRTFLVDEQGFSYQKTTEETKTEWKKGKPVEMKSTHTASWDIPWGAVTGLTPYEEQYKIKMFGTAFRVRVDYNITTAKYGSRSRERETVEMTCKTREDLADVVAALRVLTGK